MTMAEDGGGSHRPHPTLYLYYVCAHSPKPKPGMFAEGVVAAYGESQACLAFKVAVGYRAIKIGTASANMGAQQVVMQREYTEANCK